MRFLSPAMAEIICWRDTSTSPFSSSRSPTRLRLRTDVMVLPPEVRACQYERGSGVAQWARLIFPLSDLTQIDSCSQQRQVYSRGAAVTSHFRLPGYVHTTRTRAAQSGWPQFRPTSTSMNDWVRSHCSHHRQSRSEELRNKRETKIRAGAGAEASAIMKAVLIRFWEA
ncbi:hypothetical protein NDU88_006051 [Pleurodeles waltl]|uniref:Uncharacterized protein n=1 Tax=Pleurodeles waltl TaxID=8319 RepID=A0AAV7SNQ3_PLEWA|nr:hypothetical protein NDU88_006051 [Pleurodeles waltl]